ncbi:MAG TPA: condensation domain-containing protein [Kofleriaceae bacterium]
MSFETLELGATDRTSCAATCGQEYFFYLERQDSDPRAFVHSTILRLDGPLERDTLARSVDAVLARHSVYRTRLFERDGQVLQEVLPPDQATRVERIDRSPLPESAWGPTCHELVREHTAHAFEAGRLARALLLTLAPDHHALILFVHHAVSDAGSTATLIREVFDVYTRLRSGAPPSVTAAPPLQFIDYAAALEAWADTPGGQAQRAAWSTILDGAQPLRLPVDHPRDQIDGIRDSVPGGIVAELMHPVQRVEIPAATVAHIAKLARVERTSPYAVYLAAFAATLRDLAGQDDVSMEVSHSPRFNLRLHRLLQPVHGLLTTWTIARVDLAGAPTFADQVRRARHAANEVAALGPIHRYYQTVPVGLRRAVYNYVPLLSRPRDQLAPELHATRLSAGFPVWKRPWELHLTVLDGKTSTQVFWTGSARLFRADTTRGFLDAFLARLPA